MTTQVDPVGFLVPDEKRFVRSWVQTNELNQDTLDSLLGNQILQSYTPIFSSVDGTTPPNPGDSATVEGLWFEFYGLVYAYAKVTWGGANLDPGSGNNWFTFTLPVAANPDLADLINPGSPDSAARSPCIGEGAMRDDTSVGTNSQNCTVMLNSSTTVMFLTEQDNAQRAVNHETPFTWAADDLLSIGVRYRRAL